MLANAKTAPVFNLTRQQIYLAVARLVPGRDGKLVAKAPSFDNIASGAYPISRSLYFYVKNSHVGAVPGIRAYVTEFLSDDASGDEGYLVDKGLIPLPETEHAAMVKRAAALQAMTGGEKLK